LVEIIRTRALAMDNSGIEKVIVVNEASACPDQSIDACYSTSQAEKFTRGALKSSFDRYVSSGKDGGSTLVILDSMNYIKGFRYELHCISKAAGQKHGVVWVLNESKICKQWNRERRESNTDTDTSNQSYSDALMDELMLRFEPPDARNRWDRPLYRIDVRPPGEKQRSSLAKEALEQSVYNMHKLSDAIDESAVSETSRKTSTTFKRTGFKKKPVRPTNAPCAVNNSDEINAKTDTTQITKDNPSTQEEEKKEQTVEEQVDQMLDSFLRNVEALKEGMSTKQHVSSEADVLHNVDSITQRVCSLITAAQNKSTTAGGRLSISINNDDEPIWFDFNRRVPLPELRRFRRQYIQWAAFHPPEDASERGVAIAFMTYIAAQ
jgi:protein KTI12